MKGLDIHSSWWLGTRLSTTQGAPMRVLRAFNAHTNTLVSKSC